MPVNKYPAFAFRQRPDAPLQVAFVASSQQIDNWSRVPTKNTGNVRNFQRAEIAGHVKEIEGFFENESNCSPTAVVVGFDPFRSRDRITLEKDGAALNFDDVTSGDPTPCQLVIDWPELNQAGDRETTLTEIEDLRQKLIPIVYEELHDITSLKREELGQLLDWCVDCVNTGNPIEFQDDSETDEDQENPDLPEAVAELIRGLSPSEREVVLGRLAFLAGIAPEGLKDKDDDALNVQLSGLQSELKPGILIDGQHRVGGTKAHDNIPFLVTALPGASWPELAFQFIVTNRTARRVPESLLISIIGNSLSKTQRELIDARLRKAKIRVGLIEAVMLVHEDSVSPFHGKLAFGLKGESGFLDAAAMRSKVVQYWYERKGSLRLLTKHLCEGKNSREKTEFWKSEDDMWFRYFCAFWDAVKRRYDGDKIFTDELVDESSKKESVSKLMTATVLKIFQETIIESVLKYAQTKERSENVLIEQTIPNAETFGELIHNTLNPLIPAFYEGWTITGFDGSRGARDDLSQAIRLVIEDGKTVASLKKKPHRLYKPK